MHHKKIAIIGAGNMGSCLLGGLLANHYPAERLWLSNPSLPKLNALQARVNITTSNTEAANHADIILLAVKPLILPTVLKELAGIIKNRNPLIISIAAGVQERMIQHYLSNLSAIVRAMPNIPAMLGCGATALFANANVTAEYKEAAEDIFRAVGTVVWLTEEKLIDAATAVSGSGPAYFFLIMEAMQDAGVALGLPSTVANLLTLHTAYGAALMALESDKSITELRDQVTSKGGTTEAALQTFEQANIREIFSRAVAAANSRAEALARTIEKEMES